MNSHRMVSQPALMFRVAWASALGVLTLAAFVLGASPFEVRGQNSIQERVAGWIAVGLYSTACQFWLSRKHGGGFRANWPTMVGFVGALLAACILIVDGGIVTYWPIVAFGCVGSFAGFLLSMHRPSAS